MATTDPKTATQGQWEDLTNKVKAKLSHANLTTSTGIEKTTSGSGTNTAINLEVDDTVVLYDDILPTPSDTAFVDTANIVDGAVTSDKINWSDLQKSWVDITPASGIVGSPWSGIMSGVQATIINNCLYVRFGVGRSGGATFTVGTEFTVCTLPATIQGVDISAALTGAPIFRTIAVGRYSTLGFALIDSSRNVKVCAVVSASGSNCTEMGAQICIPLNWGQ